MSKENLTIKIPEEVCLAVQQFDVEYCSRRDIIVYIMQNDINIPQERMSRYQKEYEDKYFSFEAAKNSIEKEYVIPVTEGRKCNWSLDYSTSTITINFVED